MDRTKELQDDLERTGVEKNLRDSGKSVKSRKGLVHKGGRRRRTYETVGRVLKAEKDLFTKVEGGEELYEILCEIFKAKET